MSGLPTTHAGVVTRLLAAGVDVLVVAVLTVGLDLAAAGVRFVWSPVDFQWPRPEFLTAGAVILAVAVLYLTVGWATTGRTYGGRLLGLRVLTGRLELLGWVRSFLRALTCVVWPVGLLWSAVSSTRSSLQDIVFRTVVVYDTHPYIDHATAVPHPRQASDVELIRGQSAPEAHGGRSSPGGVAPPSPG